MKKAGIPIPQYPKAPVYRVTQLPKRQNHARRDVGRDSGRNVREVQSVRGVRSQSRARDRDRDREREYRPPSKIRRGTWGGDRRSSAFKGRLKRMSTGRESPAEEGDSKDWVDEVSSPVSIDGNGLAESGGRGRGTGRRRSIRRGRGRIGGDVSGGGSRAGDVSMTTAGEDTSIGRTTSPALAIISNDDPAVGPRPQIIQISPPARQISLSASRGNSVELLSKEPFSKDPPKEPIHPADNTSTTTANDTNTNKNMTPPVVKGPYKSNWGGRKAVSIRKQTTTAQNEQQLQEQRQGSPEL